MNALLSILQLVLALHTVAGAVWKFSNSEQTVPSLRALPHGLWMALGVVEILCALGLVVPMFAKRLGSVAPVSAACIAGEMLVFTGFHLFSGVPDLSPIVYWLVVAAVCAFVAYGRLALSPIAPGRE